MKYKKVAQGYVIRCFAGEEFVKQITDFCVEKKIESGWIWGLGAVESVVLGYFDTETKQYVREEFQYPYEVVSLTGNIAVMDGKPILHMHVCLADENSEITGGHLFSAIVSATVEIFIMLLSQRLERRLDFFTGLPLLDLGNDAGHQVEE
jgi:predicted DNA-binding protein with PD1-like motif